MATSRASARINRGGSFDHLSQSCAGVLAATLEELWIVAREVSARVGGDPGSAVSPDRTEAPGARPPKTLAVLQTAGFSSVVPEARDDLRRVPGAGWEREQSCAF